MTTVADLTPAATLARLGPRVCPPVAPIRAGVRTRKALLTDDAWLTMPPLPHA
jgi:hypothetical protein